MEGGRFAFAARIEEDGERDLNASQKGRIVEKGFFSPKEVPGGILGQLERVALLVHFL